MDDEPILLLTSRIDQGSLARLVQEQYKDMVKYVVDVEQGIIAIGGEMHSDAEDVLLERGSAQKDVWGANYYPGKGPEACVEATSLINIRPSQGNRSMEIEDPATLRRVREVTFDLVGRGEPL